MIEVRHISTEAAPQAWPTLGGFVNKAARRYARDYSLDDMKEAIFNGDAALFGVFSSGEPVAAVVTSEIIYPKRSVMLIELLGGSRLREWWPDFFAQMQRIARAAGYDAIEAKARAGWSRVIKSSKLRQAYVAYELEL